MIHAVLFAARSVAKFLSCSLLIMAAFVILEVTLAVFNVSVNLRQRYINFLLCLFDWSSRDMHQRKTESLRESEGESSDDNMCEGGMSTRSSEAADRPHSTSTQRSLIKKEATSRILRKVSGEEPQGSPVFTVVDDSLDLVKAGMEAVIEDEVTSRFSTEQLTSWNLLTRSSYGYQHISLKLTAIWFVGLAFRYLILFPINIAVLFVGMAVVSFVSVLLSVLPESTLKRSISSESMLAFFRILLQSTSGFVTFHNRENVARPRGICVANHTSPIDVLVLAQDNCYALVGQKQGGFLGFLQKSLSGLSSHVWFEREEASDRYRVRQRLQEHVDDPTKLPILIFPEGTCINNTSVMMFKKGSFEVGGTIYPVAIKYDPRFGDAFWNSSKQSYFQYLVMMMTSWALVCDVWYLPPMTKQEDESSITFANRVKKAIAEAGGLVDLQWDGQLKRHPVKKEMVEHQRELYSQRIIQAESCIKQDTDNAIPNAALSENLKMASAPA